MHDDRHSTPDGSFRAALGSESPSADKWAKRFEADCSDGSDTWESWHPDSAPSS